MEVHVQRGKNIFIVMLGGIYCNQGHINRRDIRSSGILRWAKWQIRTHVPGQTKFPLRMEPNVCTEMFLTTKLSCVTPQKCADVTCNAVEARYHARKLLISTTFLQYTVA